jgi:predicted metal-binding protein
MLLILLFMETAPIFRDELCLCILLLCLFACNVYMFGGYLSLKMVGDVLAVEDERLKFDFLRKRALELGASDAKVIFASDVVVEDRVVLKCKVGCSNYGKTLMCPPHTPSAEEFRKIVGEYRYALFMKFTSRAEADLELQKVLSKAAVDPSVSSADKERAAKFWAQWKEDKDQMLKSVVALEREAMRAGYSLAVGFVSGACQLCEKCSGVETGLCVHQDMARMSEDAVGVNVKKTAAKAGISVVFPFPKNPESFALLLID